MYFPNMDLFADLQTYPWIDAIEADENKKSLMFLFQGLFHLKGIY